MVDSPEEQTPKRPEEKLMAAAEETAVRISTQEHPRGRPGRPFDRRSPFFVGMAAAAGVAVTYGLIRLLILASGVLILIGLALFLAVGMEPATAWMVKHKFPRWAAVSTILLSVLILMGGFLAAAIPVLVTQGTALAKNVPVYFQQLQDHSSFLGRLNDRFKLQTKISALLSGSGSGIFSGLLGVGEAVFSALTDSVIVLVLTIYFLVDLPRVRNLLYRLIPNTRRPRAILIGDDILARVGAYVLGNLAISAISGVLTFAWLLVFDIPYAFLLALLVALVDLVPVVGSTVGGAVVALVALSVSVSVSVATIAFFIVYRLGEDYLLVPRIIGRAVKVPAVVTVVAVLIGGALMGIIGALVAIPTAAALLLLSKEVLFPRLDQL